MFLTDDGKFLRNLFVVFRLREHGISFLIKKCCNTTSCRINYSTILLRYLNLLKQLPDATFIKSFESLDHRNVSPT